LTFVHDEQFSFRFYYMFPCLPGTLNSTRNFDAHDPYHPYHPYFNLDSCSSLEDKFTTSKVRKRICCASFDGKNSAICS
ncbi:MAG: hypothetical protein WBF33_38185, partial [Candidatus Nitrosopolaris sp.]